MSKKRAGTNKTRGSNPLPKKAEYGPVKPILVQVTRDSGGIFGFMKASAQQDTKDASEVTGTWPWPIAFDALVRLPDLNPWHARCCAVIAAAAVGIGYDIAGEEEGEDGEESPERIKLEALSDESFSGFCAHAVKSLQATGNGYLEVVRNKGGEVGELDLVPTHTMWINKDKDKPGFKHKVAGSVAVTKFAVFDPDKNPEGEDVGEIIHLKTPYLADRHYGVPEWLSIVRAVDLDNNMIDYNSNFFANSAIPEMVIIVEGGEFTPEVEEAVKNFLTREFKGVSNSHRTLYIPVPDPNVKVRLEILNKEVRDASYHQGRVDNRDEIVGAHGVPPRILGIMSAGQLGGGGEVEGQLMIFDQIVLQPIREKLAKVLNKTIVPALGIGKITFHRLDITTGKEDSEALAALVAAGIITANEARAEAGYEGDLPESDPSTSSGQAEDGVTKAMRSLEKMLTN